ncbi:MAG: ATP-binding protein [Desulfurivibrionaceae bacterium]
MTAAARHTANAGRDGVPPPPSFQSHGEKCLTPADFAGIDALIETCWDMVKEGLSQLGYGHNETKIHLALHEALVNAWKHGNCRRPDLPITFRWRFADDFTIEILDAGPGFACQTQADPFTKDRLIEENGRGLAIIRFCADKVSWQKNGSQVIISFGLP